MNSLNTWTFSGFTLNCGKRTLFRDGFVIKLRDKDFDVLRYLVENAPKPCSHDELIEKIWDGIFVESSSVDKSIANIRKALVDDFKNPTFIKTIRSKGYLFVEDLKKFETPPTTNSFEGLHLLKSESRKRISGLGLRPALFGLGFVLLLAIFGIAFWNGKEVLAWYESRAIFADDFSEREIDPLRWTTRGKTVRIENGIAKLVVEETDNCGRLLSNYFSFDPNKPITIKSRLKIAYSKNLKDKFYFHGYFCLSPKTSSLVEDDIRHTILFGVFYTNYDYEAKYPDGNTKEQKAEGFFLVKNGGVPYATIDYAAGKISPRIEPIWDKWFDQKLVYEPFSGNMKFFINNEQRQEFNVGKFSTDLPENKLRLEINPAGWWLNHSIEVDYVEVSQ